MAQALQREQDDHRWREREFDDSDDPFVGEGSEVEEPTTQSHADAWRLRLRADILTVLPQFYYAGLHQVLVRLPGVTYREFTDEVRRLDVEKVIVLRRDGSNPLLWRARVRILSLKRLTIRFTGWLTRFGTVWAADQPRSAPTI